MNIIFVYYFKTITTILLILEMRFFSRCVVEYIKIVTLNKKMATLLHFFIGQMYDKVLNYILFLLS